MSNIREKTIGQLFDSLCITNQRCWREQDLLMDTSLSAEERLKHAVRAQQQNSIRTELIRAIDSYFNDEEFSNVTKTYHSYDEAVKEETK